MSSDPVTAKALAVAGALILVGVVSGATIHNAFQPARAPVTENVTAVVAVETLRTYETAVEGEVHAANATGETVTLQSESGREGYSRPADDARKRLYLQLWGYEVRATLVPDTCQDADACEVVIETSGNGSMVDHEIIDPAEQWRWTVEATETTADPVQFRLEWWWTVAEYREVEAGEHPHDERDGRDDG